MLPNLGGVLLLVLALASRQPGVQSQSESAGQSPILPSSEESISDHLRVNHYRHKKPREHSDHAYALREKLQHTGAKVRKARDAASTGDRSEILSAGANTKPGPDRLAVNTTPLPQASNESKIYPTNRANSSSAPSDPKGSLDKQSQTPPGMLASDRGAGCSHKSRRLIGYVASWSSRPLSLELASRYTNLIYAFAGPQEDGSLYLASDDTSRQRLGDMRAAREFMRSGGHDLELSLAIGGWTYSEHFSGVLANTSLREVLIRGIVGQLTRINGFDGVDIDWEYPVAGGPTKGRPEDRENYVSFVRELRARLPVGKLISVVGASGERPLRGFDIAKLSEHLDWFGVTTYDFTGALDSESGSYVVPNAPLWHAAPARYSSKLNVDWAIKQYVCRSREPSKIVLGLPFFGRFWHKTRPGVDPQSYPLYRKAEMQGGTYGDAINYRLIEKSWLSPNSSSSRAAERLWDSRSSTPWALDRATGAVLTYDNADSIAAKIKYALERGLGGVMVWSVEKDDDEMTLTRQVGNMCAPSKVASSDAVKLFKCNPLGDERRWWTNKTNGGACGRSAPLINGYYAHCDPNDPNFSCCSESGFCGSGKLYCDCENCVDYSKDLDALIREPVKPSRPILWHVEPANRYLCGDYAPRLNGTYVPTCNPDDAQHYCCSISGSCGASFDHCNCPGCRNYRKLSLASARDIAIRGTNFSSKGEGSIVGPTQPTDGTDGASSSDKLEHEAAHDPMLYLYRVIIVAVLLTPMIVALVFYKSVARLLRSVGLFLTKINVESGESANTTSVECRDLPPEKTLNWLIKSTDELLTRDYIGKPGELIGSGHATLLMLDEELMSILVEHKVIVDRALLTLGHVLGSGQYGRVYKGFLRAADSSGGDHEPTPVAVKVLQNKSDSWPDHRAFLEEGLMMEDFDHENVLTLIGVAFDPSGVPMVITPFMLHGDLKSYISGNSLPSSSSSQPSLTIRELIEFGVQIAQGMAYLSKSKFVHRDLAARNCMLDEHKIVKVADFGLSRDIYGSDYYSSSDKACKLPIRWMALESLQESIYTTKSDVWSYGVVLWELTNGCIGPYPEVDNLDILLFLEKGRRLLRPRNCPTKLYDIMLACWRVTPSERPSFDELVASVTSVTSELSILGEPDNITRPNEL